MYLVLQIDTTLRHSALGTRQVLWTVACLRIREDLSAFFYPKKSQFCQWNKVSRYMKIDCFVVTSACLRVIKPGVFRQ